jgi:hypothetical protein
MNIQPGYNPEKKRVTLCVESNLVGRYFKNLSGLIRESSKVPKDTEIELCDERTALITFPIGNLGSVIHSDENKISVGISVESMEVFQKILNEFTSCALRKELKTTEFIPLYGYPKENLKNDIQEAVKNKRKLCIIKDYSEYLEMSEGKTNKYIFHQIFVEFGTHEYTEAAILLYNEKLEELREMFEDSLRLEDWC